MHHKLNRHLGDIRVVIGKDVMWDYGSIKIGFILTENNREFFITPTGKKVERKLNEICDPKTRIDWLEMDERLAEEMIKALQDRGIKASDKEAYEVKAEMLVQQLKLKDDLIAVQDKRIEDLKGEISYYNRKEKK